MKNILKILGAVLLLAGTIFIFITGDAISIILETLGCIVFALDYFLAKRKEKKNSEK